MNSDGYLCLTDQVSDCWEVRAGSLLRHHLSPRHFTIDVKEFKDTPKFFSGYSGLAGASGVGRKHIQY